MSAYYRYIILVIVLSLYSLAYGLETLQTGYRTINWTKQITTLDGCQQITSQKERFIPTSLSSGWNSFKNASTSLGVSIGGCPINGSCGASANACLAGMSQNYSAGSCGGSQTWQCAGSNGGSTAYCSIANGACPINGSCNTSPNSCIAGMSQNYSAGSCGGSQTWQCAGSNGGSTAYCSIANGACVTYTYSWQTGAWGSCSATCGGGTQNRTVICRRSDGQTVSDTFCGGGKPTASQSCNMQACCSYAWRVDGVKYSTTSPQYYYVEYFQSFNPSQLISAWAFWWSGTRRNTSSTERFTKLALQISKHLCTGIVASSSPGICYDSNDIAPTNINLSRLVSTYQVKREIWDCR